MSVLVLPKLRCACRKQLLLDGSGCSNGVHPYTTHRHTHMHKQHARTHTLCLSHSRTHVQTLTLARTHNRTHTRTDVLIDCTYLGCGKNINDVHRAGPFRAEDTAIIPAWDGLESEASNEMYAFNLYVLIKTGAIIF